MYLIKLFILLLKQKRNHENVLIHIDKSNALGEQFCSGRKRVKIENKVVAFELVERYELDKKNSPTLHIISELEYASVFKYYVKEKNA